jgi:hypothetical protein
LNRWLLLFAALGDLTTACIVLKLRRRAIGISITSPVPPSTADPWLNMDAFTHLSVMLSIFIGLGISHLLTASGRLITHRDRVRFH